MLLFPEQTLALISADKHQKKAIPRDVQLFNCAGGELAEFQYSEGSLTELRRTELPRITGHCRTGIPGAS
jgi:hypothetical protein